MTVRIWSEVANGIGHERARKVPGFAHGFLEVTDRPMPTIQATRPTWVLIEDDGMFRVWTERSGGLPLGPSYRTRRFPWSAHEFQDATDGPCQTVDTKTWRIAVEPDAGPGRRADPMKPPYRVPTMREITALKPNGLKAISTFSGCGGSSLGYRMAGYKLLWASEFVPAARDSYRANADASTLLDARDIRLVQASEILDAIGLRAGELDLMDGSPPCSSFSTAGKREKSWGKVKSYSDKAQRTDDLFHEFARLVKGIQPRVFVAENVSGLIKGTAKGYFLEILAALKACGYRVEARLLDAQWLGVPQARQRLIFVGVRNDLGLAPAFPRPLAYRYSVRDALPWITGLSWHSGGIEGSKVYDVGKEPLQTVRAGGGGAQKDFRVTPAIGTKNGPASIDAPAPTVLTHGRRRTTSELTLINAVEPETDISRYAIGAEWDKIKPGEASERYFSLVKPALNAPCPALTIAHGALSAAGVVHPTEKRRFSIAELRRICGFPDDFVLTGTYAQQWERLGRAVPPVMMSAIASVIRDRVLLPAQKSGRPKSAA